MKYLFLICISIIISFNNFANNYTCPYYPCYIPHSTPLTYKSHEGFVVLKNHSDTIYGNIFLGEEDKKSIAITLPRATKPIIIQNDSIDFVRLFAVDTTVVTLPYTEFKVLGKKHRLWRLLGKVSSALYDNTLYCDEKPGYTGENLLLVSADTILKASYSFTWDTKADIIRFMNKHYHTNYKRKDFRNVKKAILKEVSIYI